jgi:hypothetical protein
MFIDVHNVHPPLPGKAALPPSMTTEEEAKIARWIEEDKGLPPGYIKLYPPAALAELIKQWNGEDLASKEASCLTEDEISEEADSAPKDEKSKDKFPWDMS